MLRIIIWITALLSCRREPGIEPRIFGIKNCNIKIWTVFCHHAIVINFGAQRGRASRERFLSSSCALIKIVRSDYFAKINVVNGVVASLYREEISAFRATGCNQFLECNVIDRRPVQLIIYRVFTSDGPAGGLPRNLLSCTKIFQTKLIISNFN